MKKLILLSVLMFALAGCNKDDTSTSGQPNDKVVSFVPHFYGAAMLDEPAPTTRGVANTLKIWSKPMAEENLTVKFLNGTARYKDFVKDAVKEWEKAAGVRFIFVEDDENALIRVGFDHVPGMMSSWALTGTDHLQVYNKQNEATVHFAQWRRASDMQKRSDVLRAFGQVLGLELEFRHPSFYPAWITDGSGKVDEATIREYWENELAEFITWPELKKIVLDPLQNHAFLISKTNLYDQESVMNWPFYEMIASNIPPIEFDEDYKSELSAQDKEFIQRLYGESLNGMIPDYEYFPLIEFEYTGTLPRFSITTTKNLIVIWDKSARECTHYDLPTDTTSPFVVDATHTFVESKTRKIIIAEKLKRGQDMPIESHALTKFDFTSANYAKNINIKQLNHALSYIRIIGGMGFPGQVFNFTSYEALKELYLVQIRDSKVIVDNCPNLEVFATSRSIHKPTSVTGPLVTTPMGTDTDGVYSEVEGPVVIWPNRELIQFEWPVIPEWYHSISDLNGSGLTIQNCDKLHTLSLENIRVKHIDFSKFPFLEYIYLSSTAEYIVGGSNSLKERGEYLVNSFNTLYNRGGKHPGQIVLRGISSGSHPLFASVKVYIARLFEINTTISSKNWAVVWDSGCEPYRWLVIDPPTIDPGDPRPDPNEPAVIWPDPVTPDPIEK